MSEALSAHARNTAPSELISVLVESGDLFFEWDLESDRIAWTGRTDNVLGLLRPQSIEAGRDFLQFIHPEDLPLRVIAVAHYFEGGPALNCEYRLRGDDGVFRWVQERAIGTKSPAGGPARLTGVIRNVSDRKESESRLQYLSNHDALTGQINRLRLREALNDAISDSMHSETQGGFVLVGADKLGIISEVHGEDVADSVVLSIAQGLEQCIRGGNILGRVGFDRFAIVLRQCADADVHKVADRILTAVRRAPMPTPAGAMHVTASAGITVFPTSAANAREAVSQADSALRNARRLGCDCYSEFRDVPSRLVPGRQFLAVTEQVQRALRDDRRALAFQPVVDAATEQVAFYEALVRMLDDNGKPVPAAAFVPIVEQMGLMRLIDRRVLSLGLGTLEEQPDVRLSINVSGLTAVDPVWLRQLRDGLQNRPQIAKRLTLEITETVALDDIDDSSGFVRTLSELGCRVALDDFGAGFTSFRHLRALNIDMIKIDGSFIRDFANQPDNQLFVRTLLGLADGIGLTTVAEWVETAEEATLLRQEGITYLQGYHYGAPTLDPGWTQPRDAVANG